MKPFSFSLEAVLVVRAREEQAAAEEWARAVQARTRAEQVLAAAKREMENAQSALGETRRDRFHPGDQSLYLHAIANQKNACDRLAVELGKAAEAAKARHVALLHARMKREVLSRLKEKKMNEYQCSVQAMEEAAIDDLIIAHHGRRRADL